MTAVSESVNRIAEQLRAAHERRQPAGRIDLSTHNRVIAHVPEDMTVTVETGITLAALQEALGKRGQWLPLDPQGADRLTIRELLDENRSGPRRFGYGTARDWLIGLKAVMADGRVISAGANVVKNVAGYDLHKLLIGARGELAVIVEATFKVGPVPESEIVLETKCSTSAEAMNLVRAILNAPVNPVVLDLVQFAGEEPQLIIAFDGTARETAWQREQIGGLADWRPATLDYELRFYNLVAGRAPDRKSVLPEDVGKALEQTPAPWIARAGNGVIYCLPTDGVEPARVTNPLSDRIRRLFDPHKILEEP